LKKLLALAIFNNEASEDFTIVRHQLSFARKNFSKIQVTDGAAICALMEAQFIYDTI